MRNLLLLHGALADQTQFNPLRPLLEDTFHLHLLTFEGHGGQPLRHPTFRMEQFATNVLDYLDANAIPSISIFGYSMGGYVALYLARHAPERVEQLVALAPKLAWTPEDAAREVAQLDAEQMLQKVPRFAQLLEARHSALGWRAVLQHTSDMMLHLGEQPTLGAEDFAQIAQRVRIAVGDRDSTVSLEECSAVYRLLPQGELEVLPATPHPFERAPHARLAQSLIDFFAPKQP